jgi:hypothetical protein
MADVLSGGGGGPAHPGRWLAGLAVVALALGIPALLRSGPDAPAPDRAVTVVAPPTRSTVVSVAVGTLYAYALVSTCDGRIVHECDYRVHRRDFRGPGWRRLELHVAGRTTTSLDVTLLVTPDDRVTLVDGTGAVHASADGGDTITTTHLRAGPPVAAMPRGSVLASGLCESCDTTVTVLDPVTGELHRLAAQPAFRGFGVRLARADGPVLWAADIGPGGAATAVSGDAGRSWRLVPLAPGLVLTAPVALAPRPGGGAYLVGRRAGSQLPDVRRIDSPAGSWRRFTPPTGPVSAYSAVTDERGLVVGDGDGRAWRLMGDGSFLELATTAGFLAGGPGRVLLGLPPTPGTVLLSYDGGVSWKAEHVG